MHTLWVTIFYQPIYNALVFLINSVTFGDVGVAIVILTILVKLILFPLSKKSIKSQLALKKLEPLIKELKKTYPKKEDQAKQTFALYKEHGVNPFSGFLLILIQLPIIIALYYSFYKGLSVGGPLYSFMQAPKIASSLFLGFIDMHNKSLLLAVLAGITQFFQAKLMMPKKEAKVDGAVETFAEQMQRSMSFNMKYFLPVLIAVISYQISAAVALYWVISNICTITQEWYVRKSLKI